MHLSATLDRGPAPRPLPGPPTPPHSPVLPSVPVRTTWGLLHLSAVGREKPPEPQDAMQGGGRLGGRGSELVLGPHLRQRHSGPPVDRIQSALAPNQGAGLSRRRSWGKQPIQVTGSPSGWVNTAQAICSGVSQTPDRGGRVCSKVSIQSSFRPIFKE